MGCVLFSASLVQPQVGASGIACSMKTGKARPLVVTVGVFVEKPQEEESRDEVVVTARQNGVAGMSAQGSDGRVQCGSEQAVVTARGGDASCSSGGSMASLAARRARNVSVECRTGKPFAANAQNHAPEVYVGIICPVYYGENVLLDDMTRLAWDDGTYMKY